MKPIRSLVFFLLFVSSPCALAGDFEAALAAVSKGDGATAVKLLEPLAEKGDVRAQSELGALYAAGRGVAPNPKESFKWTKKAAEQGNAAAQANLGSMYLEGQIVQRDYKEAMKWNLAAAGQGMAAAQANIASMYYEGAGVSQDYKEAARWMRLAAVQGDAESQINLGTMYVVGQGVERNSLLGYMWTSIGLESLPMKLEEKKAIQDLADKGLSAEEIGKAKAMAQTCKASGYKDCG